SESAIGACASAPRGWACPRGSPPSGGPAPGGGGLSPSRGPASVDRGLPPRVGLPPRAGLPPRVGPASAACAACSPFLRWLPRSSVVSYGLKRALRGRRWRWPRAPGTLDGAVVAWAAAGRLAGPYRRVRSSTSNVRRWEGGADSPEHSTASRREAVL